MKNMTEREQLKMLVESCLLHSDFTITGSDADRLMRILKAIESRRGRVTVEDALRHIKTAEQLGAIMLRHSGTAYPPWLEQLAREVITGSLKLTGGRYKAAVKIGCPPWLQQKLEQEEKDIIATGGKPPARALNTERAIDLVGLFDELHERYKFKKGDIYQALAEALGIQGHGEIGSSPAYTIGAEAIRSDISKLRNQLK